MRPPLSWVPASIPRILLAGTLICLAVPATTHAAGINLSWDECGAAGAEIKTFACDSNTGEPFSLVASFVPPPGITHYLGLSADMQIAGPLLPDWWKHGNGSCRGSTGLSASFDPVSDACVDYWQGRAVGGFLYEIEHSGPNTALLRVQAALPFEAAGPLDPGSEYYAFTVRLQRSKSAAPENCAGCDLPVGITLEHIKLFQPPEANNDPVLTAPIQRRVAFWQDRVTLPSVTSVSPLIGGEGTPVRIEGTGLSDALSVRFGGVEGSFQVESDQAINAVVPAAAHSGPIMVITPNGTATSAASFTAPPLIDGFTPTNGLGGTVVTITGFNLASVTAIQFNGAAAEVGAATENSVRTKVPASATTGPITVTNPAGTTATSSAFAVNVNAPPVVTSIEPVAAPTGSTVVILGSRLSSLRSVRFGGINAAATVVSDARVDAIVPPLARSGPIVVTTAFGTAAGPVDFTAPPVISSFTPLAASPGVQIQINGFNFTGTTAVRMGGVAASFDVISDAQVFAQVPPTAITGPIEIGNAAGTTISTAVLHIGSAPTLVSFAPHLGAPGTTVVIEGTGFSEVQAVRFGGVAAGFTVVSVLRIEAIVPPLARSGPIEVTTGFGPATTSTPFTAPPVIESLVPAYGRVGAEIEIRGYNFAGATGVRFVGVPALFAVLSDVAIRATVPDGATSGPVSIDNVAGLGTSTHDFVVGDYAGGINLAWNDCGTAGTTVQGFACDTNTGAPFSLVASFVPPPGMVEFLGVSATLRITGDQLPDWWQHGSGLCRGNTGIATNFDFTSGPFTCLDFYVGAAAGGFAYDVMWGDATTSRLRVQMAVPFENRGPVNAGLEYYAFKVYLLRSKSVGSGACSGCDVPRQITLDEIQLFQPPQRGNDPVLTVPLHSAVAFWQSAPGPVLPEISLFEPTRDLPGRPVSIAGRHLTGATSVRFGTVEAAFEVESDEHILATVPVGAVAGPITVVSPGGTATSVEIFQVGAPTIMEGPNLVADPSFENSVVAWRPVEAIVDRSSRARSGDFAMSVRPAVSFHRFDLNDRPNHVASTPRAGSVYTFKAWIKAPAGVTARLRVKEYQGATSLQTTTSPEIPLTTLWQRLACEVTSLEAGTTLDFQFVFDPSVSDAEVLVDDISIREHGVGPVVAAPELVEAIVGAPVEVVVTALANGGPPLVALDAELSGLPMLSDATFTPDPDFSRGVLRWTPQPEDAAWDYSVTFRARSQVDGIATTRIRVAAAPPDPRTMLVNFDGSDISRWREHRGGRREWTSPGRSSSPGALLVHSPDPATTFGVNDYPNFVAYTGTNPGERFRFTCWMRAVTGAGKGLLRVNEYVQNVKVGSSTLSGELLLTDDWQQVVVERVSEAAGSSFDLRIECDPSTPGTSFMVDDLSIRYPQSIPAAERFAAGGSYVLERPTMFPNPVRERATLSWSLAESGLLKVGIYDVNGRRVRSLVHDPEAQAGTHHLMIERRDARGEPIAAGVYFYRIESADGVRQGRFVILD